MKKLLLAGVAALFMATGTAIVLAAMIAPALAEEPQNGFKAMVELFRLFDMWDRSWLGTALKNYDPKSWNGVWPNPAEIEYNLKLQYMREWESDPPTMK